MSQVQIQVNQLRIENAFGDTVKFDFVDKFDSNEVGINLYLEDDYREDICPINRKNFKDRPRTLGEMEVGKVYHWYKASEEEDLEDLHSLTDKEWSMAGTIVRLA